MDERLTFKFDYLSERFEVQFQDLTDQTEQDFCGFTCIKSYNYLLLV